MGHPLRGPRLDEIYDKARAQNSTLPATLEKFVNETLDGERGTNVVNGHVKWQKALMQGLQEARAKAWQRAARKADTERVKEMAGEWIPMSHHTGHTSNGLAGESQCG